MSGSIKNTSAERHEGSSSSVQHHDESVLQIAVGALMVAAAQKDGKFDAFERTRILKVLRRRFGLTPESCEEALAASEEAFARTGVIHSFTAVVKKSFSATERVDLLEMLFEVVYADRFVHGQEASILRHLARELDIPDDDYRECRERVTTRLGIQH